jgi:hypothetical protein
MSTGPLTAREQAEAAMTQDRGNALYTGNLPVANADEVGTPNGMPQYKRGRKVRK